MNEDTALERRVWPPLHCRLLDHCDASMNTSLSRLSLCEQVKQAVLAALAQGEWKQGDAIPPEKLLAERFGVSIGTLRKAIDELAPRTSWCATRDAAPWRAYAQPSFLQVLPHPAAGRTKLSGHRAAAFPARAPRPPRESWSCRRRAGVRVREPAVAQRRRGDDGRDLPARITLSRPDGSASARTAQHAVRAVPGRVRGECHRHRRTAARGLADRAQARWLGVQEGEPLLEIRRVAYSYNRQPVEWRISRVNTAAYEYLGNQPWGRSPQRLRPPGAATDRRAGSVRPGFGRACRDEARFFCLEASWLGWIVCPR